MRTPTLLSLTLAVAVLVVLAGPAGASSTATTGAADDVRALGAQLESLHPSLFRYVSRKRFRSEVESLAARAPRLGQSQLLAGLMRIAALPGSRNGHTGIYPLDPSRRRAFHLYPLRLYDFGDALYVVDEAGDDGVLGARLRSIGGVPIERVLELVRPLVPRDNAVHLRAWAPHFALVAEVLDGLGIVDGIGPVTFGLQKPDGSPVELELAPFDAAEYVAAFRDPLHGHYPATLPQRPRPLYLAQRGRELWMTKLAGGRAIYVGYNAVTVDTFAAAARLKRLLRSRAVSRVIVDVRMNGGGDNTTYGPLLAALQEPKVNRRDRLFVLVGRATFSAAGNFVADAERYTRATTVGEPIGGGLKIYSESTSVLLPATGVNVRIATEYMERGEPGDRRLVLAPDVRVPPTASDFFASRDPVLARALRGL